MKRSVPVGLALALVALASLPAAAAAYPAECSPSADRTAPATPTGLKAAADDGTITLTWDMTTDEPSGCVYGYRIYQDGRYIGATPHLSWTVGGLTNGRTYQFSILAFDFAHNWSSETPPVAGTPSAASAPPDAGQPPSEPPTGSGFGTSCGPGNWPDASKTPFALGPLRPFARPIPSNPPLLTSSGGYTSAQMVAWLNARGRPAQYTINTGGSWDYSHPYYCATSTDPLVTLRETEYVGDWHGTQIRIPAVAHSRSAAAAGGDGHITIIQPDGSVFGAWQYSGVWGGVASASSWARESHIDTGDGQDVWATTAAGFNNMAGQIRLQELEAGVINHALFIYTNCTWGNAVYPAKPNTTARRCGWGQAAPPLGAHLQLDPNYTLPAGLPAWKYPILRALQKYGGYVGDTGAYGRNIAFGIEIESGQHYVRYGEGDRLGQWAAAHSAEGDISQGTNGTPYYLLDFARGVDWSRLRIVDPCVASGSC